jgi:hypothetical protein
VTLTVSNNSGSKSANRPVTVVSASAIIIDHTCAKLAPIPSTWIGQAKQTLHIAYGYMSHGSQVITGMTGLVQWKGSLYDWNIGGTNGALDIHAYGGNFGGLGIANDLGSTASGSVDRTAWDRATRQFLPLHPEINVVMWAWCWQADGLESEIQLYLDLMAQLERDFPNIKFIYQTGHVNGGTLTGDGWSANLTKRNNQIRNFCIANNKILYDFADIESWDPDGNYFGDKLVDCDCSYDSNADGTRDKNWAVDWQNAHPGEWYNCISEHSQPLNANLKAYAAWWLWARLAGWTGN